MPSCEAKQVPDRSGIEKHRPPSAPSVTAMDITIHTTFLPHDDPDAALAFYRDTLGFEVRNDVGYNGMHWITVGPPDQPARQSCCTRRPPTPGSPTRSAAPSLEMMAKGTLRQRSRWPPTTSTHLREAPGHGRRGHPGADRPAVRHPRLRRSATPAATWSASTRSR